MRVKGNSCAVVEEVQEEVGFSLSFPICVVSGLWRLSFKCFIKYLAGPEVSQGAFHRRRGRPLFRVINWKQFPVLDILSKINSFACVNSVSHVRAPSLTTLNNLNLTETYLCISGLPADHRRQRNEAKDVRGRHTTFDCLPFVVDLTLDQFPNSSQQHSKLSATA
jgi:hypothetical protein